MAKKPSQVSINDGQLVKATKDGVKYGFTEDFCLVGNGYVFAMVPRIEFLPKTMVHLINNGIVLGHKDPEGWMLKVWERAIARTREPAELTRYVMHDLLNPKDKTIRLLKVGTEEYLFGIDQEYLTVFFPGEVTYAAAGRSDTGLPSVIIVERGGEPIGLLAPISLRDTSDLRHVHTAGL